jgi:hypothetical protein
LAGAVNAQAFALEAAHNAAQHLRRWAGWENWRIWLQQVNFSMANV